MFKAGDKVRYLGPDLVTYETGKIYEVTGYDKELDAYGVMSELGESYYLGDEYLQDLYDENKPEDMK